MAKQLRTKWRAQVDNPNLETHNNNNDKAKEKRKLKDPSNSKEDDLSVSKKLKTKDENVSLNSNNNHDDIKQQKPIDKTINSNSKDELQVKSIKTAKCKSGKMRSIGVLEKTVYGKPISANGTTEHHHHKSNQSAGNSFITKGSQLINQTSSLPSLPLNKLTKSSEKGITIIEAQPLPASELLANSTASQSSKHIIKESAGFMDALSSLPTPSKLKKKKKTDCKQTADKPPTPTNKNLKDDKMVLDERLAASAVDQDRMMDIDHSIDDLNNYHGAKLSEENNSLESTTSLNASDIEFLVFSPELPYSPNKQPKRSILQYFVNNDDKRRRKKLSWADESGNNLEKVKLFETDAKERCNMFKQIQNFDEHRKEETGKERNLMRDSLKSINNPGTCYMNWCLREIDFDNTDRFASSGQLSVEAEIQKERLKCVLEDIDLLFNKSEFPKEPDAEIESSNLEENATREIPLEDENNQVNDYSNEQFKIVNEHTMPFATDSSNSPAYLNTNANNLMNAQQFNNYNQMINNAPFNNNVNYSPMLNGNANLYNNQQPQPQPMYNMYNGVQQMVNQPSQMMTDQKQSNRWSSSNNWDNSMNNQQPPVNQPQLNNYNSKQGNKNNHFSKNKGNKKATALCRFYQNNGNCKHGVKCMFLHSK